MMGSGKSTIGKQLASELNLPFSDLDSMIESEQGQTIPEIFERRGEPAFRDIERKALCNAVNRPAGVLSLGGGSLQDQSLVDLVKENGILVYLECRTDTLFDRLKSESGRPMIAGKQDQRLRERLANLLNQRQPYYRQAHIIIRNDHLTPGETVNKIINHLESNEEIHPY